MVLHKCGAENAIGAKFCKGCGETLADATNQQANSCPECGAPNKPGAKFCGKCGTGLSTAAPAQAVPVSAQTPIQNDAPPVPGIAPGPAVVDDIFPTRPTPSVPGIGALPTPRQVNSRGPMWLVAGVLVIAAASGAGWWFTAGNKATQEAAGEPSPAQSAPKSTTAESAAEPAAGTPASASESASMTMPTAPADEPSSSGTAIADRQDDRANDQALAEQERKARVEYDRAKRKAELNAQRKADQEMQQREAMETRRRDMERYQMEEARRRAQQAEVRTVQDICADKRNPFSRSRCEARECSRPDQVNTRYCVDMRRDQQQGHIPGM